MFVVYLATSALLLGLTAVVVFAAMERLRGQGRPSGTGPENGREADGGSLDGMMGRLTEALGLSVESRDSDRDGVWWVCERKAPVTGGRFVILAGASLDRASLSRLRDRVRAEGALKGIAVAISGFDSLAPLVLDDVTIERLSVGTIESLAGSAAAGHDASAASRPPPDRNDPVPSTGHGEGPDESPR
jgi:hypothetical protein